MKNLLIYISPEKRFNVENEKYIKIQIENSLDYWRPEDIMLVTNFPYEYMGVKSLEVPDELYSTTSICVIKINVIIYLLDHKLLNEPAWFHDTEAWQIAPFDLQLEKDLVLTDYGWDLKWNGGSMFFKPSALDMFKWWKFSINEIHKDDEKALMLLTERNFNNMNERIQRLNVTYNLGKRHRQENYYNADKPLKVVHFHPYREGLLEKFRPWLPKKLYHLMHENISDRS